MNYYQARQWSLRQKLHLTVVELVFGDTVQFEIESDEMTRVIQMRTLPTNVMWQKEALLNVALRKLPEYCTKVVWLDSDVILEDGWIEATSEMLDLHPIGQSFTSLVRLPKGIFSPHSYWSEVRQRRLGRGFREGQMQFGFVGGGHTGFAWAARRRELEMLGGLYSKAIVGGFDALMVHALFNPRCEQRFTLEMQNDFELWAERARQLFTSLGQPLAPIRAAAYWHGEIKDRNYSNRHNILLEHKFDPNLHVSVALQGELEWTKQASAELQREVLDMFIKRREDGYPPENDEL